MSSLEVSFCAYNVKLVCFQELRKPSYAEICQRTSKEPPSSPLQPPKEQKPNTVGCGKEEKKLAEPMERYREPSAPKSTPGAPKDQRRQPGRRPSPPAVGKRLNREQNTPPKSPQWKLYAWEGSQRAVLTTNKTLPTQYKNESLVRSLQCLWGPWDACKLFFFCESDSPTLEKNLFFRI